MRVTGLRLSCVSLTCLVSVLPMAGQQLISAKSGLIHYTEGDVKIGEQAAGPNNGVFQSLANGKDLITGEGRAEMLLGPGQFVRLNENSALHMVSNKLEATRIDVLRGSVLIEIVDLEKAAPVTVGFGVNTIELRKAGLYRVDAASSLVRIYSGEAVIEGNGQSLTVKKGKEVSLGAVLAQNSFDASTGDEFSRWAERRAGYVATANVSGARDIYANGQNWSANNWAFNPWYGMYTYVPSRRMLASPFGFNYFTPDMAFNGMFWPYIGGGYGFYGNGFGYGYGSPFYGMGSGYGYYGSGPSYYNGGAITAAPVAGGSGTGGKGGASPKAPGYPIGHRPDSFGPRGPGVSGSPNAGGSPSMVRGYGSPSHVGGGNSGGGYRGGGGGYSSGSGGGHSSSAGGGGSYSGGGHSSSGGASSGSSAGHASSGGAAASSSGAGAATRSK